MASEFSALLDDDEDKQPATGVLAYLNQFKDTPVELQQAEQEYYGTPNTMPGFVGYNSPASMPTDVYQGLLQALKPTPLGTGMGGSTLEPELQAKQLAREHEILQEEHDMMMAELQDATLQEQMNMMEGRRKNVRSTIGLNIQGQEWEVPTSWEGMSDDAKDFVFSDMPVDQWPQEIIDEIENHARDNLEQGLDPFGEPLPNQPFSPPPSLPGT